MKTHLFLTKWLLLILFVPIRLISSEFYYKKISNENPRNFIEKSNWYFRIASNDDKPFVLYYKAQCWYDVKDRLKAADTLVELEEFLDSYKNYFIASKVYGRMAFLYQQLGYKFKSDGMMVRSEQCLYKIIPEHEYRAAEILLNFRKAMISSKRGDKDKAMSYYKKADHIYMANSFTATREENRLGHNVAINIGDLYMDFKDFDKALYYNILALKRFDSIPYSGAAYANIGSAYSKMNNDRLALVFYKISIMSFLHDKDVEYLNASFDSIKNIYSRKKDFRMASYYLNLQRRTMSKLEKRDDFAIELQENEAEDKAKGFYYILGVLILALLLIFIYKYHIKFRTQNVPVKNDDFSVLQEPDDIDELSESGAGHIKVALNVNADFQEKLSTYEETMFFLSPDVTLATIAVKMNTSSQNVSELINRTKQMNFNTYINTLRVNYIMKLLKDEPRYRVFKIAYLAEISGFLSHSTFTKVFKNINGYTPSEYIDLLNAMKDENE
ncbi:MAG: helix-turn-helix domain-containing protein [Chryseobacterium sp.]|nr:helix-turn-helix domain-containing protein [Chryseobacterium sp.]